jgi:23S rRNA pseudouridine1911/1915/1917 synthase
MKLETVFENENLVAFNKPSGMLSIPDRYDAEKPCIKNIAEKAYGKLFVVHRIDRDTSGLIVFAKNEESHKYLSQLFQSRNIEKYYIAIVQGNPFTPSGTIEKGIMPHPTIKGRMVVNAKGKEARTDYEVLQSFSGFSVVRLRIYTGRTHQIRVHMKDLGYPLVCDPVYGHDKPVYLSDFKKKFKLSINELDERPILSRLALHAHQIKFQDMDGQKIDIIAPLSKDMSATIKQMEKWAAKS